MVDKTYYKHCGIADSATSISKNRRTQEKKQNHQTDKMAKYDDSVISDLKGLDDLEWTKFPISEELFDLNDLDDLEWTKFPISEELFDLNDLDDLLPPDKWPDYELDLDNLDDLLPPEKWPDYDSDLELMKATPINWTIKEIQDQSHWSSQSTNLR